jgi:hypothetical protein
MPRALDAYPKAKGLQNISDERRSQALAAVGKAVPDTQA